MTEPDPSPSGAPAPAATTHGGAAQPGTPAQRGTPAQPWAPVWAAPPGRASSSSDRPPSSPWAAPAPAWSAGTTPPPSPRRRWPWVVGALGLVLLLAGGTALAVLGGRAAWEAVGGESFFEVQEGDDYGDNPVLDALWDDCAGGDGGACDDLFDSSDVGTAYEDFGYTCGDRFTGASAPWSCAEEELVPAEPVRDGARRGDDAALDRLWDDCAGGDGIACDELYASAREGTEYAEFGVTCGERYSAARAPDFCAEALG